MSRLEAGWKRFADADWDGARIEFEAALEVDPDDPGALDGLGQSLWWLGKRQEGIDRRREAFTAYQRAGDSLAAGGLATYLAGEQRIDGRAAEAEGWLARARRLVPADPPSPELGWLRIEEAKRSAEPEAAERCAREALTVAHDLRNPDIECMALAQIGAALTLQGQVEDGMTALDEAMTIALAGESSDPLATGDACCTTLIVCDRLADLPRATQWCEAVVEFADRRRFLPLQSWCRGIYGSVLVRSGDWERADAVLTTALAGQPGDRRRGRHDLPLSVLAGLRLCQGREEEVEQLLTGIEDRPDALAPAIRLRLRRGELELAEAMLDRAVATAAPGELQALRCELALAAADPAAAAEAAGELRRIGSQIARADLIAEADLFAGRAALESGDAETALTLLEGAAAAFAELRFPLDEARARLALARAQARTGSPLAAGTATAARDICERLGARRDADEAAQLLREMGLSGRSSRRGAWDELTDREREVLSLIAAGLSNAEIAERLVIAPKTAEHHVGRVLNKLGVRNRAEAAAYAVREGL